MAEYNFLTTWEFEATPEQVWPYVGVPEKWTQFWPGLEEVRLLDGPGDGAEGSTYEFVFKSFLPYTVTLIGRVFEVEPKRRLVITTTGELEGTGTLTIEVPAARTTRTSLKWDTRSTVSWMNVTAPLFRGLYEWNHDFLMKKAGNGLAAILDAPILHRDATGTSLARALAPFGAIGIAILALRKLNKS